VTLPIAITLFISTGLLFGMATYTRRHLFSEGHTKPGAGGSDDLMETRWAWTLMCGMLWPLLAFSGAFSWWVRRGR
jgi:hypothetical protein